MSAPRLCECSRLWREDEQPRCTAPLGRRYRLVRIVPEALRGSARASGAYDCYGSGANVPVSEQCYRRWVSDAVDAAGDCGWVSTLAAHRVSAAARHRQEINP